MHDRHQARRHPQGGGSRRAGKWNLSHAFIVRAACATSRPTGEVTGQAPSRTGEGTTWKPELVSIIAGNRGGGTGGREAGEPAAPNRCAALARVVTWNADRLVFWAHVAGMAAPALHGPFVRRDPP